MAEINLARHQLLESLHETTVLIEQRPLLEDVWLCTEVLRELSRAKHKVFVWYKTTQQHHTNAMLAYASVSPESSTAAPGSQG